MLTVIGEAVIDLIQDPDGRYTAHPGGSPLNVAVGLARLNETVGLKARFSTDALGRQLHAHAATSGVDLAYAVDAEEPATLAAVSIAQDQTATYSFYVQGTADWQWTQQELSLNPRVRSFQRVDLGRLRGLIDVC
jgi:fructokinase